jgi:hypothetical protein
VTPTRVPEDTGVPVGLFDVEPLDAEGATRQRSPRTPTPTSDEQAGTIQGRAQPAWRADRTGGGLRPVKPWRRAVRPETESRDE